MADNRGGALRWYIFGPDNQQLIEKIFTLVPSYDPDTTRISYSFHQTDHSPLSNQLFIHRWRNAQLFIDFWVANGLTPIFWPTSGPHISASNDQDSELPPYRFLI